MNLNSVAQLDDIDGGEISDELIVENILDKLPFSEASAFIKACAAKLGHGAKLVLQSTDLMFVAKLLNSRKITVEDGNAILYGDLRCSAYSPTFLENALKENGLKVLKHRMVGASVLIVAERP